MAYRNAKDLLPPDLYARVHALVGEGLIYFPALEHRPWGEMIGDCGLTMQLIGDQIKPEIGYHIRADHQRMGYATEAAKAVRDWAFENTPFNILYSYMKHTNTPSCKTAMAYGCRQVDEFPDEVNEITKVYALTREEWLKLR